MLEELSKWNCISDLFKSYCKLFQLLYFMGCQDADSYPRLLGPYCRIGNSACKDTFFLQHISDFIHILIVSDHNWEYWRLRLPYIKASIMQPVS